MWAVDMPSMCTGMRGLVAFSVALKTASIDLHSGSFGGAVRNAAHVAAELATALHDADGRVTLPGYYDAVRPVTDDVRDAIGALPFSDAEFGEHAGGATRTGEAGFSTLERIWVRPTAEVTGIQAGYAGEGMKTIVPATATLKVTFRLVPDQDPDAVTESFHRWLDEHVPDGVDVDVTPVGGVAPALTPLDHPAVLAAARVIERVWDAPCRFTREGGSGPEEALGRVLCAPVVFLGVGLPDDQIHAPNERIVLEQLWKGLLAVGELWFELAAIAPSVPRVPLPDRHTLGAA
jgi:acetylornithine deacetylase/succinyl-diaminopimelate desuccinylase-like protein